jgi:hypothetical protein
LDDRFKALNLASQMPGLGRLRVLPLPIALPGSRHSRWLAEQLTFVYSRTRPQAASMTGRFTGLQIARVALGQPQLQILFA